MFKILLLLASIVSTFSNSTINNPYQGCLLFVDDFRSDDDFKLVEEYSPDILFRSWYRFGKPSRKKLYKLRESIVSQLLSSGVKLGGGVSLSVVNNEDLKDVDFDSRWLSVDLDSKTVGRKHRKYASLSSPGFRSYLVTKVIEQVQLGVSEIHLGETAGEIHFDQWTMDEFSLWIRNKYKSKPKSWWVTSFGSLGLKIFETSQLNRSDIRSLSTRFKENFFREWGVVKNWKGLNSKKQKSFLYDLYIKNLDSFILEIRNELKLKSLYAHIDVWGFADWINDLTNKPDAIVASPPDSRWKLNWNNDESFDLVKYRKRIKHILKTEVKKSYPVPVIMMIDHPKPFYSMAKFSDERQVELMEYFSKIALELDMNFVIRSYTHNKDRLMDKTKLWLHENCRSRSLGHN